MTARKPKRAVLYARVSTDRGEQDPESQLVALRRHAESCGLTVVAEESDRITADPKRRRREPPGLTRALRAIEERRADMLLIFSADRLVAEPVALLQLVARVQDLGGTISSVQDRDLDTTNEFGELMVFMTGWFNRWRLKLNRAHSIRGQQKARAEGRIPGRPRKVTTLVTAEQVAAAREQLRAQGKDCGSRPIADLLNENCTDKKKRVSATTVLRVTAKRPPKAG